jgi:hypothetical protein
MQSSGASRRENANVYSIVIVREGGRSSIPETSVIESMGRSVDASPSRGMTTYQEPRPSLLAAKQKTAGITPPPSDQIIAE